MRWRHTSPSCAELVQAQLCIYDWATREKAARVEQALKRRSKYTVVGVDWGSDDTVDAMMYAINRIPTSAERTQLASRSKP